MIAEPTTPLVFLGPTLDPATAVAALPGAAVRPPIARGDLYAARERGHGVLIIIDGVFHHRQAISPREVIDVVRDGARVIGASSMGALRAAECWPAGMVGMGGVYHLYRRGTLRSDDEVVVMMDDEQRAISFALINLRYAARVAVRNAQLSSEDAAKLVQAAQALHFGDRSWEALACSSETKQSAMELEALLGPHDLKRADARLTLRYAAELQRRGLLRQRVERSAVFRPSPMHRERSHDAIAQADVQALRLRLARAHLIGGRYAAHLPRILATRGHAELSQRFARASSRARLLAPSLPDGRGVSLVEAASLRLIELEVWTGFSHAEEEFADALWAELTVAGELDAELYRLRAFERAKQVAAARGLEACARHRLHAVRAMLAAHGLPDWEELMRVVKHCAYPWSAFVAHRNALALALAVREQLFDGATAGPALSRAGWRSTP